MTKQGYAEGQRQLDNMRATLVRTLDYGFTRTRRAGIFLNRQRRRLGTMMRLQEQLTAFAQTPEGRPEAVA